MAKLAVVVLLALAAVATQAKPLGIGGGVVSKNHVTTSSHIISPHLGLGYGMLGLGYPGVLGKTITHHSTVGHVIPHFGLGLHGLGLAGLYPGIGLGGLGIGGIIG